MLRQCIAANGCDALVCAEASCGSVTHALATTSNTRRARVIDDIRVGLLADEASGHFVRMCLTMSSTLYDIPVRTLAGEPTTLRAYAGHVLLIVNVASKCGLTPQYASLEKAFETQRERGLAVLGFPSNQFMAQEPGTPDEIATFCSTTYGVQFPLFEKIDVNGDARHPIYDALVAAQPDALEKDDSFRQNLAKYGVKKETPGDVFWNFEKFLVARDGSIVGRFAPDVTVDDAILHDAIERELAAT